MTGHYDITVVITTYNRSEMIKEALASVMNQQAQGARYEVVVVDNNSTDETRQVVEEIIKQGQTPARYVFEARQGVSYARNTGIGESSAPIIAFADDDVVVAADWVAKIKRAFDSYSEIDCIGGKVMPVWKIAPPRWLTRDHWMPLALQDYGGTPLLMNHDNPLCLVSANLALRRSVFEEIGLFAPELQRVKDGIGSMEDAELMERYWQTGRACLYMPDLIVSTEIPAERMTKSYHRRWHAGHGHFLAIMRSRPAERSSRRLFDVPGYLYKQAFLNGAAWFKHVLLGRTDRAFANEIAVRFFAGFFRKRRHDFLAASAHGSLREILSFIRSLASKGKYSDFRRETG